MDTKTKTFFPLVALLIAMTYFCLPTALHAAPPTDTADETMGHGSAADVLVAKVNGEVINMDQLMRKMTQISRTKHGSEEVSPLLAEKIKREAIDKLVTEELAVQAAQAKIQNITPAQTAAKIEALKKKYKTEEAFQKYVKTEFGGMDGLLKQLKRSMPLELYIAQEFDAKATVNDQEVAQAYEAAKAQSYVTDEFVQVHDLLFFLDAADPESKVAIEKITKSITEQYDNDPSKFPAAGAFTVQRNVPLDKVKDASLYEAAKGLKEYGWSAPIDVEGNLHAVQLVGYKPAVNKSLEQVAPQLKQKIRQQKIQAMIDSWRAGLKEGAKIEIMDLTR